MLRNADSAKENEDPYPGRMSLIERCNGQSAFGNACNNVASTKNLFFPVATILQAPKSTFSSLQQSCKPPKALSPRCNNLANAKNHFFPVATMLQAFPKAFWPSRGSRRNSLQALFLHRTHVTKGLMRWDFLRLDKRRTGGAKRLHTITWIRFIPKSVIRTSLDQAP